MLRVTYLGNSGWVVQAGASAVLIDPLLHDDFGRGPRGARMPPVWPPRSFDLDSFPRLSAVVISHEHEDHFNLPSLHLVDRAVPVLLSARASVAARTILAEMGFGVELLAPGERLDFGPLQLTALSPDHLATFNCEEWDGLALLARDEIDGGLFFTTVDLAPTEEMVRRVASEVRGGGRALVHTNNLVSWLAEPSLSELVSDAGPGRAEGAQSFRDVRGGRPTSLAPGNTLVISSAAVAEIQPAADFAQSPPEDSWPPMPPFHSYAADGNYTPASGRFALSGPDFDELLDGLQRLAEFIYASPVYKRLYSLTPGGSFPARLTFALLLIADAEYNYFLLEYQPAACAFKAASAGNPFREYLAGVECWATDLLAVFRGEFEPRILSLARSRYWSHDASMPDPFIHVFWPFFHPQRRPAECLSGYRTQLRSLSGDVRIFRARG